MVVVFNMTPVPVPAYTLTVPAAGCYQIEINSDDACFGGSGYPAGSQTGLWETARLHDTEPDRLCAGSGIEQCFCDQLIIDLPPLCGLILRRQTSEEFIKSHGRKGYGQN